MMQTPFIFLFIALFVGAVFGVGGNWESSDSRMDEWINTDSNYANDFNIKSDVKKTSVPSKVINDFELNDELFVASITHDCDVVRDNINSGNQKAYSIWVDRLVELNC